MANIYYKKIEMLKKFMQFMQNVFNPISNIIMEVYNNKYQNFNNYVIKCNGMINMSQLALKVIRLCTRK